MCRDSFAFSAISRHWTSQMRYLIFVLCTYGLQPSVVLILLLLDSNFSWEVILWAFDDFGGKATDKSTNIYVFSLFRLMCLC